MQTAPDAKTDSCGKSAHGVELSIGFLHRLFMRAMGLKFLLAHSQNRASACRRLLQETPIHAKKIRMGWNFLLVDFSPIHFGLCAPRKKNFCKLDFSAPAPYPFNRSAPAFHACDGAHVCVRPQTRAVPSGKPLM